MLSFPAWLLSLLQIVIGLVGLYLILRRDRREIRKEANSRLEKIDERLLHLDRQVSYMAGRLDAQHRSGYENARARSDRRLSAQHRGPAT